MLVAYQLNKEKPTLGNWKLLSGKGKSHKLQSDGVFSIWQVYRLVNRFLPLDHLIDDYFDVMALEGI